MKKGIIVLLITVLAAGMVFAGTLTGSAGISFGFDLDKKDWGFDNSTSTTYKFTFALDTTEAGIADHETNIWAEIAAKGSAEMNEKGFKLTAASITKANIHIDEVTIGILDAGGAYDYVADYHKNSDGDPENDLVVSTGLYAPGFTVSYSDWNGGFGAKGNTESEEYTIFAHIQTPAFQFVEGLSTQAAAAVLAVKDNFGFYFAASAAYTDGDKLNTSVAAELALAEEEVDVEAAASASYDFVSADVYFYTLAADRDADKKAYLDAKVAAKYTIEGDVTVALKGYVDTINVLADAREIELGVEATATIKPVEIFGKVSYAIYAKKLGLEGKVTYTHEVFTAYADLKADIQLGDDSALLALKPELSISSSKIVENAKLALTWKGADFAKNEKDEITKKGAITASATIEF